MKLHIWFFSNDVAVLQSNDLQLSAHLAIFAIDKSHKAGHTLVVAFKSPPFFSDGTAWYKEYTRCKANSWPSTVISKIDHNTYIRNAPLNKAILLLTELGVEFHSTRTQNRKDSLKKEIFLSNLQRLNFFTNKSHDR